ncbi:hypothetical protein ACIAD2115 [Acinetobacter baylyi ADP1]|uniref:Uncharacterized protein n=1 Tax=Acinetobacter baylyi (strain ATCC 33305 / BD413 / ADP1) TaxID=62977 RepID=Q6FAJ1_ACIAD|nr:hypothetical protein ACIAD2115 [Acinetobacter baylyi ADP1]
MFQKIDKMSSKKATLMGLTAICLRSMIVALIKEVSRDFGPHVW